MSIRQERLSRLHGLFSDLDEVNPAQSVRTHRRDALVRMWLSGEQEFLAQVYRDAAKMVPDQRIRADVWFVVDRILDYAQLDESSSGE